MGHTGQKPIRILLFVATIALLMFSIGILILPGFILGTRAPFVALPLILLALISIAMALNGSFLSSEDAHYRLIIPHKNEGNNTIGSSSEIGTAGERESAGWRPPRIDSSALLKTAAEQKQTIEKLTAEIRELEKKLSGSRMHEGIEDSHGTLILWNEKPFRRMVDAELWRSRRSQRPMTLIFMNFKDARPQRSPDDTVSDSTMWEYYSEAVCRAVRRGDHVGLGPRNTVCALLPETTSEGARIAEKRIRDIVDREHERRKKSMDIDLVMDVATVSFPNHGKTPDEIFSAGKKGLLKAQRDRELP